MGEGIWAHLKGRKRRAQHCLSIHTHSPQSVSDPQTDAHTQQGEEEGSAEGERKRDRFPHLPMSILKPDPEHPIPQKGSRKGRIKEDSWRCGDAGLGVVQEPTAKGQMNVEMAVWAKKAPLPHTNLFLIKTKRSSYSVKKKLSLGLY